MGWAKEDIERYERAQSLAPRAEALIFSFPREGVPVEVPSMLGDLIMKIYSRMRSLFEGTQVLLRAELPEEALFLVRSMLADSLRLMELAANPEDREAMALWWRNETINRLEGLGREAAALGLEGATEWPGKVTGLRSQIERYRQKHEVKRLIPIRDDKQLARAHGLMPRYWDFRYMSELIHRADLALLARVQQNDEGVFAVSRRNQNPGQIAAVSVSAMEWALRAQKAVASIFDWDEVSLGDIDALLEELDSVFDEPLKGEASAQE